MPDRHCRDNAADRRRERSRYRVEEVNDGLRHDPRVVDADGDIRRGRFEKSSCSNIFGPCAKGIPQSLANCRKSDAFRVYSGASLAVRIHTIS